AAVTVRDYPVPDRRSPGERCLRQVAELNALGAVPQRELAEPRQLLRAFDDRREVVRPQLTGLRREVAVAVRHQQLGLALPARVEGELAGVRVRRRVLRADAEVAVAPRDPV